MRKVKWVRRKWMFWGFIILLVILWGTIIYLGYRSCTNPEDFTRAYAEGYWAIGVLVGWFSAIAFWLSIEVISKVKVRKKRKKELTEKGGKQ